MKKFIEFDLPRFGGKVKFDKEGGGIPRFVLHDEEGTDIRTLNISELSLLQIRSVLRQIGISPIEDLLDPMDVDLMFQADQEVNGEVGRIKDTEIKEDQGVPPPKQKKEIKLTQRRGTLDVSKLRVEGQVFEWSEKPASEITDL